MVKLTNTINEGCPGAGHVGRFSWCLDCHVLHYDADGYDEVAFSFAAMLMQCVGLVAPNWEVVSEVLENRHAAFLKAKLCLSPKVQSQVEAIYSDVMAGLAVMMTKQRTVGDA